MLAYCDKIADVIQKSLTLAVATDPDRIIGAVGSVKMDLHPTEGWFQSTKKTIEVADKSGKTYIVTVEEV